MKKYLILILAMGLTTASAQLDSWTTNWTGNFANLGEVPDNDFSGWLDSREVSLPFSGMISKVDVTLDLSGGWNGDMYAYLLHDGILSVLLNRVGTPGNGGYGYSDGGFNVTLSSAAAYSIHSYQDYDSTFNGDVLMGTWQPDGAGLGVFDGMNPAGSWILYLADENSGGVMTVNSWGLQIELVPEPTAFAVAGLGGLCLLWFYRRKLLNSP